MAFGCTPEGQLFLYYETIYISRESETGTTFQLSHKQILAEVSFAVNQIWGFLADAILAIFRPTR